MGTADAEVQIRREGALGHIHLQRPKALNALTHGMILAVSQALATWKDDPEVVAVMVTGEGERAFCAGGDVHEVCRLAQRQGVDAAAPFFFDEYRMNWRIKRFPKPYVALLDGVTMGGGVGISVHGSHRIATERTAFAMPETLIGMFPDVGGTFVLSRMADGVGQWLALAGTRLGPVDSLAAGVATHFIPAAAAGTLIGELGRVRNAAEVDEVVAGLAGSVEGVSEIERHRDAIAAVFTQPGLDEVAAAAAVEPSGWGREQWTAVLSRSPTSVKLAFAQLARGRELDFEDCMRLEYRMVRRVLAGRDFFEGVRALLVDRDNQPRWRPAALEAVDDASIDAHFAPLDGGDLPLDWVPA
ncbi:MAG: enoyl-CoA hydratase/isomerase family protein [Pseudomonadota bacterium]